MTKDEFMDRFHSIKDPLCDKYGSFFYFLMSDVLNVDHIQKICESYGYTTIRKQFPEAFSPYAELYFNGKIIGHIDNQGFPSIEFMKRQTKHVKVISEHEDVIKPIEGVHRILSWHTVKDKSQKLAGGQIVIHFLPLNITNEIALKFLTDTKLLGSVENMKKQETDFLGFPKIK